MKVQQRDVLFSFICEILHARSACQPDDSGKRHDLSNKSSLKFSLFLVFIIIFFTENSSQLVLAFLLRKRVKSAFRLNSLYSVKNNF